MPLPSDTGRDVALLRNAATGAFSDFNWDPTGNPSFDDTDAGVVLSHLYESEYWANPLRGSKLFDVKLDRTGTDVQLTAAAESALSPAVRAGQIRSATVQPAQRIRPGSYRLLVSYQSRDGHQQGLRLPIGV